MSTLRHLLLAGLVIGTVSAGDQPPADLPHESVVLRDGRRLNGYFDPLTAILWLDGPYRARLRLRAGDIIRRSTINGPPSGVAVPISASSGSGSRQLTIRLREQQLADLDRRRQDLVDSIQVLSTTRERLEQVLSGIERTLADHPEARTDALVSQQQALGQQLLELRRRLQQLDEQLTSLARRREQAAQVLARARAVPTNPDEPVVPPDPMIELRLQALEDEVRMLRADNQELHRLIDQLRMPTTPDAVPSSTPSVDDVPVPTPMTPVVPAAGERVARR